MKKKYVNPSVVVYDVNVEGVMGGTSIWNDGTNKGESQLDTPDNNENGFWAGGKNNNFNAWNSWDDDDE